MNKLAWFLALTIFPLSVNAGNYVYQCDADLEGDEGICLAEPSATRQSEMAAKKNKSGTIAEIDSASAPSAQNGKLFFGVPDEDVRYRPRDLSIEVQNSSAAAQAARAHEKIRQVEIFLQNANGPQDGLGTSGQGPIKAQQ